MLPYSDSLLCAASTSYSSAEAGTGFVRRARTSRDVEAALASGGGLAAASLDTRRTAGRGAEKVRFTVVAADGLALAPAVLFNVAGVDVGRVDRGDLDGAFAQRDLSGCVCRGWDTLQA